MTSMVVSVHQKTGSLLLDVDDPFWFRDMIPQSKTLDHPTYNFACKRTKDAETFLRNLGFALPLSYHWPGKHRVRDHQRAMVDFYLAHRRGYNLSEMGAMKTAPTLWAADILMNRREVRRALVLAPLSSLERTWQQEIFDVLMHRRCTVVHGSAEKRKAALALNVDFYIMNHDGVLRPDVQRVLAARKDIDLIIVDEGGMFRNAGTDKYKALKRLIQPQQRLWWITGTPLPNAPTDAWAQARIVSPANVPQFFGMFKRMTMLQESQFKWVPRRGSREIAFKALQPAIRFEKKDCIDLPPIVKIEMKAPLSKEQEAAFKTMRRDMTAEVKPGQRVTAVNAADKLGKLRQILCGAIKVGDEYINVAHLPRFTVLKQAIESASAKVLVIVPFKGIIQALKKELSKHFSVGVLNGDVSPRMRNKIIVDFKTSLDPHILLCHPKVMAHSLNLTEADTLIFYAPIYSNDETQQVTERFNRAGQTRKMTVIRIGSHALEWQIYRDVDVKRSNQASVLDLYRKVVGQA